MSHRGRPSERTVGTPASTPESRLVAQRLAESTRRFNALLDHLGLMAILADTRGRMTYVNQAVLDLTGYRFDELIGKDSFEVFVPAERRAELRKTHADILADLPSGWKLETEILTRGGERRLTRWTNTVLRDAAGNPVGSAHLGEDITEQRRVHHAIAESEHRYRKLFNASPLPMWVYDQETLAFLAVNDAAVAHYGWSRAEFLGMTIEQIRPAGERTLLRESLGAARIERERELVSQDPIERSGSWRHCKRDGTEIAVEISSHAIDFDGRPARLVVANDVTERSEQQRKIARLSRIRAVIGGISSAMLRIHDRDELLKEACRVASTEGVFPMAWVTEIGPDGRSLKIVASYGPDPGAIDFIQSAIRGAIPIEERPTARVALSGRPYVVNDLSTEASLAPVRADLERRGYGSGAAFPLFIEGRVVAALVLLARDKGFFDADEIALLEWMTGDLSFALEHLEKSRRLDYLAYYDVLTGIANARLFDDRLTQFVHAARQVQGEVVVVVFDLEHFTRINDTMGRAVGDELLRLLAHRFDQRLVEPYTFGRIGADTFAVATPVGTGAATRLRDCVFELLGAPFEVDGRAVVLTAQAGIALFPVDGQDAQTVFQNAESALMLAKTNGEPFTYFSVEMNARIARRRALEDALRLAVERGQFVLHFQPRVDLANGALVGAEALVRWHDPERGLVPPSEFIELAEETGLIVPLGAWVIETVCAQQARWLAEGLGAVPIAVNLSSFQFESGDVLKTVREALARHGVEPAMLELELTESAVMKDPAAAATTLRALRSIGVGLALDDFGTGYSSLAHLKRFPFDSVKIDRSFVTDVTTNPEDAAIATAIIAMAHRLSLKVVAEGVETEGQLGYLRAEGCDEMQGNYFSAPIAREAFEKVLRSGRRMTLPATAPTDEQTLLIVDNEPGIRSALTRALRRDGYRILSADTGRKALELLATNAVQVIISDQRMPEMSGTEFLSIVRQLYPDTVRIILSGYTELEVVTDAVNRGAVFKFLTKPWDDDLLREQVRDAFRRYRPGTRRAG